MRRAVVVALPVLVGAWVTAACPSREGARPPPTLSVPSSAPPAPSPAADAGASDASSKGPSVLPEEFVSLGGPCTDAPDTMVFCVDDKVVGIWRMVDTLHEQFPPAGVALVIEQAAQGFAPRRSLALAVEGDQLWFRLVTCGACRRVMGWAFAGSLSRMTDEQLGATQTRLGLPASPALRTREAWRAVYAKDPNAGAGDAGASNK